MSYISGIDPQTGLTKYIAVASGNPDDSANPAVMSRADLTAHAKLDALLAAVQATYPSLLFDSFVSTQAFRVVKSSTGRLHSFYVANYSTTATYYLMFFDRSSAPLASATNFVLASMILEPGIRLAIGNEIFGSGVSFSSGITYGFSTSRDSYVAVSTPGDLRMFVGYR